VSCAHAQALIYPGLGLGTILANATKMTDKMIVAGSKRLSELAPALKDPKKALLPEFGGQSDQWRITDIRCRFCQF